MASEDVPKEFRQIVRDFLNDLLTTFPEYDERLSSTNMTFAFREDDSASVNAMYEHVKKVFPQRFFDILYKNEEMFEDSEKNTEFVPGIDFAKIWKMEDVSEATRETIWKYLQLIMFSVRKYSKPGKFW